MINEGSRSVPRPSIDLARVGLSFAIATVCIPAAALPMAPGAYRGQLGLNWSVHDPGVAHLMTERFELELQLDTNGGGAATLHVHGTVDVEHTDLVPGAARSPRQPPSQIDETWTGRVTNTPGGTQLHLERSAAPGAAPTAQEFHCALVQPAVAGRAASYWRCDPTTQYRGMPWNDPTPAFLRVPLVLARGAGVRAEITSSRDMAPEVEIEAPRRP